MTLDKKIQQMATGEHRLDPDQQRHYLGTFAERVVLLGTIADAQHAIFIDNLETILQDYHSKYPNLQLKVSARLDNALEISYLKAAQAIGIPATVVDEEKAQSPYGFVLHTDKAEQLSEIEVQELYPDYFVDEPTQPAKKSFWQKLFG